MRGLAIAPLLTVASFWVCQVWHACQACQFCELWVWPLCESCHRAPCASRRACQVRRRAVGGARGGRTCTEDWCSSRQLGEAREDRAVAQAEAVDVFRGVGAESEGGGPLCGGAGAESQRDQTDPRKAGDHWFSRDHGHQPRDEDPLKLRDQTHTSLTQYFQPLARAAIRQMAKISEHEKAIVPSGPTDGEFPPRAEPDAERQGQGLLGPDVVVMAPHRQRRAG